MTPVYEGARFPIFVSLIITQIPFKSNYGMMNLLPLDSFFELSILKKVTAMDVDLAQKAVAAALARNWKEAVKLNREILKIDPNDTDALNRMARSLAELGNRKRAVMLTKKVLKIDPFNGIALKALKKYQESSEGKSPPLTKPNAEAFLEEPGKTKIVTLLHLGDPSLLSKLYCGDEVKFSIGSHRISVVTLDNKYIGRLSDDVSAHLRKLIKEGNVYRVLIKSIQPRKVKVFIKEIKRAKKLANIPSFLPEKVDYISFTPPELVTKRNDLTLNFPEEEI